MFSTSVFFPCPEADIGGIILSVTIAVCLLQLSRRHVRCICVLECMDSIIPINCWVIFHSMDVPQSVYPLSSWWSFKLFSVWHIVNLAAINIGNKEFCVRVCFHVSWGNNRISLLSYRKHIFHFIRNCQIVFCSGPINIRTSNGWVFPLLCICTRTLFSQLQQCRTLIPLLGPESKPTPPHQPEPAMPQQKLPESPFFKLHVFL